MTYRTTPKFRSLGLARTAALCVGVMACSHPTSAAGAAPTPRDSAAVHTARADSMGHAAAADTTPTRRPDSTASPAPAGAPAQTAADTQYLKFDAATNTVTFLLVAGPFNFNGYTGGGATLTVPPRSANVINFEQNDGTPPQVARPKCTRTSPSSCSRCGATNLASRWICASWSGKSI